MNIMSIYVSVIPCICVMSMCLPSICMSVQTVEVCVHVEMQLQLIYDLNTANTRFTIFGGRLGKNIQRQQITLPAI
jgi:hypothetical protein